MNTNVIHTFLLGCFAFLLVSCGSNGGGFNVEAVMEQDSLLTIQANRLMKIQGAIDINGKAMEMPFQSPDQAGGDGVAAPTKNPLEDLPEERMLAFKNGFHKVRSGFDGALTEHQAIIQEVIDMQKLLSDAQAELKGDAVTAETKAGFALIADQVTGLQSKIDALEAKVMEVQREAINLMMSEDFLQPGASWLMANSPLL